MTQPLEIVGGGLAGLSLGLALRGQDVPVALHEAGAYPRHRVCGEFIAGLDDATIRRLGLAPILADAVPHETVTWYRGREAVRRQRLPRPALGLSRHTLDARLADAFAAANGSLRCNSRVTPLTPAPGRVLTTGRRRSKSPWIGLKAHVVPPRGSRGFASNGLEVHLGRDAYAGLSAVEGGRWNLCGFFRRPAVEAASRPFSPGPEAAGRRFPFPLLDFLQAAGLDALAARVAPYLDPSSFTAVAALQVNRFVFRGPGLALGDACAMIPPFTGDGMAMAFQSAALALAPLAGYARGETNWPAAVRSVQSALRRRFAVRLASAAALHPFLLRPGRQRWLAAAAQAGVLPLRSLYSLLH
ncbi:MAG TPA: hypothetical protein VFE31_08375 [Opitutaceae bacterium]|nr:hypothetical protein [Opitutaceae bacterium]